MPLPRLGYKETSFHPWYSLLFLGCWLWRKPGPPQASSTGFHRKPVERPMWRSTEARQQPCRELRSTSPPTRALRWSQGSGLVDRGRNHIRMRGSLGTVLETPCQNICNRTRSYQHSPQGWGWSWGQGGQAVRMRVENRQSTSALSAAVGIYLVSFFSVLCVFT